QKLVLKLSQPYELQINQNDPTQLASHHCTASAGVALVSGQRGEAAKMLDQADAAMYQAKKAGRNQVILAPISPA
ncbi:MAG: diguanylate cyclase, partial [Rhodoferax sp.]|nr:diguanylate cyclase [Rhodoferax sp.]